MTSSSPTPAGRPQERRYPLSTGLRVAMAVAAVIATVTGFVVAYAIAATDCRLGLQSDCLKDAATAAARDACAALSCNSSSPVWWGIAGAIVVGVGAGVVIVLVSRSFGEWQMGRSREAAMRRVDLPGEG